MKVARLKEDSKLQKRIEELEQKATELGLRIFSYNHILIEDTTTGVEFWSTDDPARGAQDFDTFPRNFDSPFYTTREE